MYIELALSPFLNIYYFYRTERLKVVFYRTEQYFTEQNNFLQNRTILQNRIIIYRTELLLTEQKTILQNRMPKSKYS